MFINTNCEADGNIFVSMPGAFLGLLTPESQQWLDLPAWRDHGWDKNSALASLPLVLDPDRLELTMTSEGPVSEGRRFQPD